MYIFTYIITHPTLKTELTKKNILCSHIHKTAKFKPYLSLCLTFNRALCCLRFLKITFSISWTPFLKNRESCVKSNPQITNSQMVSHQFKIPLFSAKKSRFQCEKNSEFRFFLFCSTETSRPVLPALNFSVKSTVQDSFSAFDYSAGGKDPAG